MVALPLQPMTEVTIMAKRELLIIKGKDGEHDRMEFEESDLPMLAKAMKMAQQEASSPGRLLRLEEVEALVGLKKSAIYSRIKQGAFPAPIEVRGTAAKRWREADITAWIAHVAAP